MASRCAKCRGIASKDALAFDVKKIKTVVYDDLNAVDASARQGCDICALVFQHLVLATDQRQTHAGPITLHVGMTSLGLNWDGLQSLGLELCEKPARSCEVSRVAGKEVVRRFAPDLSATAHDLALLVTERIRPWLERCQQEHAECNLSSSSLGRQILPTRLLDIGSAGRDPHLVVSTEDGLSRSDTRYLCLSYCWGKGNVAARTTPRNYAARRCSIPYQTLPKTIRDAIDVVRALGERYLWVDAICIIQPEGADDADWRAEAPRMGAYYSQALCTLAASRVEDSADGFLGERLGQRFATSVAELPSWTDPEAPERGPRQMHAHPSGISEFKFDQRVDMSPLSERGWVFQEYALSTRLLHWTEHELLYQCAELCASEQRPQGFDDGALGWRQPHTELGRLQREDADTALGEEWCNLVNHYAGLSLTYESDRLVALQGIAARTRGVFGDEYLFGLWRAKIVLGLAWQAAHRWPWHADMKCRAPSWSWASASAVGIKYNTGGDALAHEENVKLVAIKGETDSIAFQKNVAAECRLVLSGVLKKKKWDARKTVAAANVANANRNEERVRRRDCLRLAGLCAGARKSYQRSGASRLCQASDGERDRRYGGDAANGPVPDPQGSGRSARDIYAHRDCADLAARKVLLASRWAIAWAPN
jgi:hypothetical protein